MALDEVRPGPLATGTGLGSGMCSAALSIHQYSASSVTEQQSGVLRIALLRRRGVPLALAGTLAAIACGGGASMNRAARRAFAATQRGPAPAYGRPADLFRQLAPLGVTVQVVRGHGTFRLDYIIPASRETEARAIIAAFPSGETWDVEALAVLTVVTGEMFREMCRGSSVRLSLVKLLADPVDDPLARQLLMSGVRQ